MTEKRSDETRLAEEIVGVLPEGTFARICSDDRSTIRFAIRSAGLKLRSVVLRRHSLRKLLTDPLAGVKLEYLKRDLLRSSAVRSEFRFPRPVRIVPIGPAGDRYAIAR